MQSEDSAAGHTVNKRRASLSSENEKMLIFLATSVVIVIIVYKCKMLTKLKYAMYVG